MIVAETDMVLVWFVYLHTLRFFCIANSRIWTNQYGVCAIQHDRH